jgi:hypothetical protein
MVEAALAPLHVKGGSPCEYPHIMRYSDSMHGIAIIINYWALSLPFSTFNFSDAFM